MAEDYWRQRAELFRTGGGMATEPDPPIWTAPSKIAEGSLSEMVEQWGALPQSHQGHHIIKIHNGELREANIRKMLEDPRHQG